MDPVLRRWLRAALAGPLWAAAFSAGCATTRPVRPDDMSAAEHRRAAERDRDRAADQMARYDPTALASAPGGFPREDAPYYPIVIYSPFNVTLRHADEAARLAEHARAHEQAAADLESYEEGECRQFPPSTRAACPFLGAIRVEDLPNGVRLHLPAEMPLDATLAHMRCHLAWARTRGYAPTARCPLYVRGTRIERAPSGDAVDLVSDEASVARRLQRLARGEAPLDP